MAWMFTILHEATNGCNSSQPNSPRSFPLSDPRNKFLGPILTSNPMTCYNQATCSIEAFRRINNKHKATCSIPIRPHRRT
jgi:hypothetical protein